MAHHSDKSFSKAMEDLAAELSLGPTDKFPQGKLTPEDQGEIKIAIGHHGGKVILDFGKPIAWIGFDRFQAVEIAKLLIEHAERALIVGDENKHEADGHTGDKP